MMPRAFIILLDSFGIGATEDAPSADVGADTFRHIAEWCAAGKADKPGVRSGPLHIPNLLRLGLGEAAKISGGQAVEGLPPVTGSVLAKYGCAAEISPGKDTPSGHWEMTGVPLHTEWGYFSGESPTFPDKLLEAFIEENQLPGVLGNCHASGTDIIQKLGEEHQKTGRPIVYTSADSVFQIAAHEKSFGLDRLYDICQSARRLVDEYQIGRVIARPFLGEAGGVLPHRQSQRLFRLSSGADFAG